MKSIVLFVFCISLVDVVSAQKQIQIQLQQAPVNGNNIRGYIETADPFSKKNIPLPGAVVVLYFYNSQVKKYIPIAKTITNNRGCYSFNNVKPENYFIRVNDMKNYNISVARRDVNKQFQDLPTLKF